MKQARRVARVASWDGWCSPCEREDRPLVLTRSGPSGLLAWLTGHGDDDRWLLLTCRVCGHWQVVPAREEDDPEIVLVDDEHDRVAALLQAGRQDVPVELEAPVLASLPTPRSPAEVAQLAAELTQLSAELSAGVFPVAEAPVMEAPVIEVPVMEAPVMEAPVMEAHAAEPARRLVLAPAAPEVLPEARAATALVLSAARAGEQAAADDRTAGRPAVDIPRPRVAAAPPAAATSIALPTSTPLDRPDGSSQVVLARAS